MDRVANHKGNKVPTPTTATGYADEDRRIMAAVARLILSLSRGPRPPTWSASGSALDLLRNGLVRAVQFCRVVVRILLPDSVIQDEENWRIGFVAQARANATAIWRTLERVR